MADVVNRRITLAARPVGFPKDSDFGLVEDTVSEPAEGELLLQTLYLSLDPYMRGRISEARSYAASVEIGQTMVGGTVSSVVVSHHPKYKSGDIVLSYSGWQDYELSNGQGLHKLDPVHGPIRSARRWV